MRTNSYGEYLLGLYKAALVDVACAIPSLRLDCERDFKRLLSIVETEGVAFLMLTLPAAAKHLDQCLAAGCLTTFGLAYHSPFRRRGIIPKLFKGLYLRIFHENGDLKSDFDVQALAFLRILLLMCKKFRQPCKDSDTWKSVNEFFETDRELPAPSQFWDGLGTHPHSLRTVTIRDLYDYEFDADSFLAGTIRSPSPPDLELGRLLGTIQFVFDVVSAEIGRFNPSEWRFRHGPGAVSDLRHGTSKYQFPQWSERLDEVFPFAEFAFANYGSWGAYICNNPSSIPVVGEEEGVAKLISVPKTLDKPRLIASEPVSHQWCQQSILRFLVDRVTHSSISNAVNFHSQEKNRRLALEASRRGSHCTIDLSSASDRMSCWLVERAFKKSPTLLEAFKATRTRYISNDIDKKSPSLYKLRKFSTMGSAVTFPVQTIVFCCIAIGALLYEDRLPFTQKSIRRLAREVRTFGDDIIVPDRSGSTTLVALETLGFKVNPAKTFTKGRFRESCGIEAFCGSDVSRLNVLSSPDVSHPESITSSVDVHNNFFSRGFVNAAAFVKSTVSRIRSMSIPSVPVDSGQFGFWDYDPWLSNSGFRRRYNQDLHRSELFVTRQLAKSERTETNLDDSLLQYFTEVCKPPERLEKRIGVANRPALKLRRGWVPEGQVYSA
jgi:hypothetical protein